LASRRTGALLRLGADGARSPLRAGAEEARDSDLRVAAALPAGAPARGLRLRG
jgi:hypothetical protein